MKPHDPTKVKWVKPKKRGVIVATGTEKCEYCGQEAISSHRCSNCDRYMCDECWDNCKDNGWHSCPVCPGDVS